MAFLWIPTKNGTLAFSAVFVRTFLSTKLVFQIGLGNYGEHSYNFSLDWQLRAFPDKNKAAQCQMVDFSRIKTLKGMQKVLWLIYWHSQNPLKLRQPARHHLMRMQNVWLESPGADGGGSSCPHPLLIFNDCTFVLQILFCTLFLPFPHPHDWPPSHPSPHPFIYSFIQHWKNVETFKVKNPAEGSFLFAWVSSVVFLSFPSFFFFWKGKKEKEVTF